MMIWIILIIKAYFIISIINYIKINTVTHNKFQAYFKDSFSSFKITIKISFFLTYLFYAEKVEVSKNYFFCLCQVLVSMSFVPRSSNRYKHPRVNRRKK